MGGFNFTKNQQLALLALVGLTLLGLAIGHIRGSRSDAMSTSGVSVTEKDDGQDVPIDNPQSQPHPGQNEMPTVTVHVAGSVLKSGVYSLPTGSRVIDAVKAAGGASTDANVDAINLAERLKDGEQIVIPSREAPAAPASTSPAATSYRLSSAPVPYSSGQPPRSSNAASVQPGQALVNINTGGPDELDRLPGVGPATARKIIEYRSTIGRFSSPDQLLEVKGIGPKKLAEMRPFVRL
jgi:competence protein ComEA